MIPTILILIGVLGLLVLCLIAMAYSHDNDIAEMKRQLATFRPLPSDDDRSEDWKNAE